MSSVDTSSSTYTSGASSSQTTTHGTGLNELDMDEFLKLMIAELQNQDPLDPTKNSEMLQQIGQIREIGATDQLRSSLDSMQQSQGISTASSMIGKQVQALTDDGYVLFGVVKSVQLAPNDDGTRELTLKVDTGEQTVDVEMDDIFQILPANTQAPPTDTGDDTDDSTDDGTDATDGTDGTNGSGGTGSTDETDNDTDDSSTDDAAEETTT